MDEFLMEEITIESDNFTVTRNINTNGNYSIVIVNVVNNERIVLRRDVDDIKILLGIIKKVIDSPSKINGVDKLWYCESKCPYKDEECIYRDGYRIDYKKCFYASDKEIKMVKK